MFVIECRDGTRIESFQTWDDAVRYGKENLPEDDADTLDAISWWIVPVR